MKKSAKAFRKTLQDQGAFYTPQALAMKMRAQLPEYVAEVYDPTCGDGGLLRIFGDDVRKYGVEIDGAEAEKARSIPNSTIFAGDTLATDYFQNMYFDTIIANPPFGVKLNRPTDPSTTNHLDHIFTTFPCLPPNNCADWAFIVHILYKLSDHGTAVCLMGLGALYRGRAEAKIREELVNRGVFSRIELIRDAQFEDTSIPVAMLTLRKSSQDKSILFVDGEVERRVEYSEIKENGFDLSVNRYVNAEKQEDKWKDFDPYAHEEMIRAMVIEHLDKSITTSKAMCEIDPCLNPIEDFLDRLQAVINKHRASESSPDNQTTTEDCL